MSRAYITASLIYVSASAAALALMWAAPEVAAQLVS